jgi:hypothetical protein
VRAERIDEEEQMPPVTAVVKLDPREGEPFLKQFERRHEAIRSYEAAISTSVDRVWRVVFRGAPLRE